MDLRPPRTNREKNLLIEELLNQPHRFHALMKESMTKGVDERYWWAMTYVIEQSPTIADQWLNDMLDKLETTQKDSIKRNILRSLQYVEIPVELITRVLDVCYSIVGRETEKVAARVFAMTVIYNQIKVYPELGEELRQTLLDLYEYGSPGFKSRSGKIIKRLEQIKGNQF